MVFTNKQLPAKGLLEYTEEYRQQIQILVKLVIITETRLFRYIENFTTKNWKFSDKNSDIFHISAQNIDCGYLLEPPRRGGSNGYPQSMFLSRSKKNTVYPCKPQFYYIKVGFTEGQNLIYRYVFRDE